MPPQSSCSWSGYIGSKSPDHFAGAFTGDLHGHVVADFEQVNVKMRAIWHGPRFKGPRKHASVGELSAD
jgi:hypothetical protein